MAGTDDGLREFRQKAQHRQTRLFFQHRGQQSVHPCRTVVQQDACDVAGGAEAVESLQLCGQRQALPLWLHHQQHRQTQRVGQMPRTGPVADAPEAVVKAHSPLAHRRTVAGGTPRVEGAHRLRRREKEVEVAALHPQHGPVEHGVDVVRPALEGAGRTAPPLQRHEQGAGHGGLAAARAGRRQQKLYHVILL